MGFGHLPEILGLLVLGLIVFGPKRMIELGSQLGRALRDMRSAMKDMNWNMLGDDANTPSGASHSTLGRLSQLAQDMSGSRTVDAKPAESAHVVEEAAMPPHDSLAD